MLKRKIIVQEFNLDYVSMQATECCGIYELYNLSPSSVVNIVKISDTLYRNYPMIIFHDRTSHRRGYALAKFIKTNSLGDVYESKKLVNPNTSNKIQMWIFYPNWKTLDKFIENVSVVGTHVYGSLKSGKYNHQLIEEEDFIGTTSVRGTLYSLGSYPALVEGSEEEHLAEVYSVSDSRYQTIRNMELNAGYKEVECECYMGDGEFVKAIVYYAGDNLAEYCNENKSIISSY